MSADHPAVLHRPYPPHDLCDPDAMVLGFRRDRGAEEWLRETFIAEDGRLANPDHAHLEDAEIGVLWTSYEARVHGMRIAGQMEMPVPRGKGWVKCRQEHQLSEWFGAKWPDFVMTLSAPTAASYDDASLCALVEHELYHAGQRVDEDGEPRINLQTGRPNFILRGHDVEEFVGVVRRYGPGAAAGQTQALVEAALRDPEVGAAEVSRVCGTCLKVA